MDNILSHGSLTFIALLGVLLINSAATKPDADAATTASEACADLDPHGCAANPNICNDDIVAEVTCPVSCNKCPTTVTTTTTTVTTTSLHAHPAPEWASWEQYAACQVTCATGYENTIRTCCLLGDNRACLLLPWDALKPLIGTCSIDGAWLEWSGWSHCTVTCGGGARLRTRQCVFPVEFRHGDPCTGDSAEMATCADQTCPGKLTLGQWSEWAGWSACAVSCGGGLVTRSRACPSGRVCTGNVEQTKLCNNGACPADGVWLSWQPWTECDVSCANGTRQRYRECFFYTAAPMGSNCTGPDVETTPCSTGSCQTDGLWADWSPWGQCPVTCGGGITLRMRNCVFPMPGHQGQYCPGLSTELKSCSATGCPEDGIWLLWQAWSACSVSCGNGTMSRTRDCYFDPDSPKGRICPGNDVVIQNCSMEICQIDGVWLPWSPWSTCSVTCGDGLVMRTRNCSFPDEHDHGQPCMGAATEENNCTVNQCPVDGVWLSWSEWSDCSITCGDQLGLSTRNRTCFYSPDQPLGDACPGATSDSKYCAAEKCPICKPFTVTDDAWRPCNGTHFLLTDPQKVATAQSAAVCWIKGGSIGSLGDGSAQEVNNIVSDCSLQNIFATGELYRIREPIDMCCSYLSMDQLGHVTIEQHSNCIDCPTKSFLICENKQPPRISTVFDQWYAITGSLQGILITSITDTHEACIHKCMSMSAKLAPIDLASALAPTILPPRDPSLTHYWMAESAAAPGQCRVVADSLHTRMQEVAAQSCETLAHCICQSQTSLSC
ncbi:SCO-spondin-like isoform X2 [Mya arenaria]|uniref:SCO-spondin-like isoform X2 n=1 Tax=Mya arenaria TaxID=6604 RepID=UPI0022E13FA8|nr:SCO-spondin-like isoform X2 [Mya arenaria]